MEYWLVVYDVLSGIAQIQNVFIVQASSEKEAEDKVLSFGKPKGEPLPVEGLLGDDRRRFLITHKLTDLQTKTPWAYFF